MKRTLGMILLVGGMLTSALSGMASALESSAGDLQVEKMADGLGTPWALAFLPSGTQALVSDRGGRLFLIETDGSGAKARIKGVPKVWSTGQGGLLDVMVPRDFAQSHEIFLSYAKKQRGGAGTAVARARLKGNRLVEVIEIFEMTAGSSGGRHLAAASSRPATAHFLSP